MIEWLCDDNDVCHATVVCETACGVHIHPQEPLNEIPCAECVTALDTMIATVPGGGA